MEFIHLNNFKLEFHKYFDVKNSIFPDIPTIFCSNSEFLIDCYLYNNLKLNFDDISTSEKSVAEDLHYSYNTNFIIFNLQKVNHKSCLEFISNRISNKLIFDSKILIVLKNTHVLSASLLKTVSNLLDIRNQCFHFVLTTLHNYILTNTMSSKCLCKKIYLPKLSKTLKLFCTNENIDPSNISNITKKTSDIYTAICFISSGLDYNNIIEKEILSILKIIKQNKFEILVPTIRSVIYKLNSYNISNSLICKSIATCVIRKFKNDEKIFKTITCLAKTEHNLLYASRSLYHFEYFFIYLHHIINN
jgi:hypothetical protein